MKRLDTMPTLKRSIGRGWARERGIGKPTCKTARWQGGLCRRCKPEATSNSWEVPRKPWAKGRPCYELRSGRQGSKDSGGGPWRSAKMGGHVVCSRCVGPLLRDSVGFPCPILTPFIIHFACCVGVKMSRRIVL